MALTSLGRQVALVRNIGTVVAADKAADVVAKDANDQLGDAKTRIQTSLTPYIPGDFIVSYGALVTTVSAMKASFGWLLALSLVMSFVFVWLGAFQELGKTGWSRQVNWRLLVRSIIGVIACLIGAFTIPNSGWYKYQWFVDNQAGVLLGVGILTAAVVLALKGMQKAGWLVVS